MTLQFGFTRDKSDLATLLSRALRLEDGEVVRLRRRDDQHVTVWVHTGFDVVAMRTVNAQCSEPDLVCDGRTLLENLRAATGGQVETGFMPDSAWQGALPPDAGFRHIDDIPARDLVELSRSGAALAREHRGPQGPPTSLLNQTVVTVESDGDSVGVGMRVVFALTAMGFIRNADTSDVGEDSPLDAIAADEVVRVRTAGAWSRLDARYGSVYFRSRDELSLSVVP